MSGHDRADWLDNVLARSFEQSSLGLAVVEAPAGRIVVANRALAALLGYGEGELLGRTVAELACPEDASAFGRLAEELLGGRRDQVLIEGLGCRRDGTTLWVRIVMTAVHVDGARQAMLLLEDVSRLRQSEEQERAAESRFRRLFEHNLAGMYRATLDGRIAECNEAFARMLGYASPAQVMVQPSIEFCATPECTRHFLDELTELLTLRNYQGRRRRRDGSVIDVLENAALVPDASGKLSMIEGSVLDVTARTRAEEQVRMQRDLAEALAGATSLGEALTVSLRAAIRASGMDSGGVYLVDDASGALRLAYHEGLSDRFVELVRDMAADSERFALLQRGAALYVRYPTVATAAEKDSGEDLRAAAAVPLLSSGRLVGSLNLSSHVLDEVPVFGRGALEAITAQVGNVVSRLKAEQQVRDSEQELAAVFETVRDVIVVLGLDGTVLRVNPAVANVFGYQAGDLVGRTWHVIVPPGREEIAAAKFARMAEGEHVPIPVEALRKDGSMVSTEMVATKGRIAGREVLFCVARDVTERRRMEDQLRIQHDLTRELSGVSSLEAAMKLCLGSALEVSGLDAGGAYLVDEERHALRLVFSQGGSDQFVAAVGEVPFDSPQGRAMTSGQGLFSPFSESSGAELSFRLDEGLRASAFLPMAYAGRLLGCLTLGSHLLDEVPQPARAALKAVVDEVAGAMARIRAEEAVRESERRLQSLFESLHDMVLVFGGDGEVVSVNPAAERLLGYSASELVGQHGRVIVVPEGRDRSVAMFTEALRTGFGIGEFELLGKDGRVVSVETVATTSRWGDRAVLIAMSRDVGERKRLEDQLVRSQRMEAMGRLAAGIAHELNNLLQATLGQADLLRWHASEPARVNELAGDLEITARRGAHTVRQLMLFARAAPTHPRPVDVRGVVRQSLNVLRRLIREGVALDVVVGNEPLGVEVDPVHLEQVVWNLVVSAAEAMPHGGLLRVGAAGKAGEVQVIISDSGPGLSPAQLKRVFEPFVSGPRETPGGGLGLAVVHGIVTRAGGHVEVESPPGEGTTFRVIFPRVAVAESGDVENGLELAPVSRRRLALVVEDDEISRVSFASVLGVLGFAVTAVASAEEALGLPEEPAFEVMVADVVLAGMSGLDLAERLQARWPELKVVMTSGYGLDDTLRPRLLAGAMRFLPKPFTTVSLERELALVLPATPSSGRRKG